jgi:uncharacterized protein YndB with AHSA1/START domain
MTAAKPGDGASVSVTVNVAIEDAFDVFTREIDLWWRHGRAYRIAGKAPGSLILETKSEGRLFETFAHKSGTRTFEVGKIVRWEPPHALSFEWRGVNFKPGEKTLVEVSFTALGESTLVHLRHSGWSTLPANHPARHKLEGAAFSRMIGLWWGQLLSALREHVALRNDEAARAQERGEGDQG